MNVDIVVLNCQKCYLYLTGRRSSVSADSRTVVSVVNNVSVVFSQLLERQMLPFCRLVYQVMCPHHFDHMSLGSQVSMVAH